MTQNLTKQLLQLLPDNLQHLAPDKINFSSEAFRHITPQKTLSISVTGTSCSQNCAHCESHYLKGMTPLEKVHLHNGFSSILLSGGSNKQGAVPIKENIQEILKLSENLRLNIHPGFQSPKNLKDLADRNPIISFDLPGNNEAIQDILKLPYSAEDYQELYLEYSKEFNVVPHITIGLNRGENSDEEKTLKFLEKYPPKQLVFIVFRPTPKTSLADCPSPSIERVLEVMKKAKQLPATIKLGCMRPAGNYRKHLDTLAFLNGVNSIVMPHPKFIEILQNNNFPITKFNECCALF